MPIQLTADEIAELQRRYGYLTNPQAIDVDDPILPLAYFDASGDGLLHVAARLGDARTVGLLLRAGIDVNQRGDMGCTALHYAHMYRKAGVMHLLLSNGAATNIVNEFGRVPEAS
jgi:ankyrin repeat protein